MFIVGIDGGAHTRIELRDGENRLLRREDFGPFNLNAVGEQALRALLRKVFAACGDMAECGRLCVGAAGLSNPRVGEIITAELGQSGFTGLWKLCCDQETALRGAMDAPGAVIVAGAGSVCFGKNAAGETARCGGCGHLIDDGGSGYALGLDVLRAAVRAADGRGKGKALLAAVYHKLGGHSPEEVVSFVYHPHTDRAAIAQFAAIALELAAGGDGEAQAILRRGADELYTMADGVQRRLGLAGCATALLGGLMESNNPYRRAVVDRLSGLGTVVLPAHDPLWGAAQMAWELSG